MTPETLLADRQRGVLRALVAEAEGATSRFAKEWEIFADAFSHTCGHNRLEQIGLRWIEALTPAQVHLLATDRAAACEFAPCLHRALMRYLLPTEEEMAALTKPALTEWIAAIRLGIQGVLRRRAYLSGDSTGRAFFPEPGESFLRSIQPAIRDAADEFFLSRADKRDAERRVVEPESRVALYAG
jgi:hypothetical protein